MEKRNCIKILGHLLDVIVISDSQGIITYKSANIEKTFGWKPEDLIGRPLLENIHPEDREFIQEKYKALLAEPNNTVSVECRYKNKDGSYTWIQFYGINLLEDEEICGILGSYQDISERKAAEQKIRESEFFLLASQRAGKIGSYKMDVASGFWISTETLDEIFGIDRNYDKNVEGWLGIVHPEDRELMQNYLLSEVFGKRQEFNYSYRIIRKNDGVVRWLHGTGTLEFDENDNIKAMVGTIRDITEQKTSEIELIKAKEKAEESEYFLMESQRTGKIGSYKMDIASGSWISTETLDDLFGIDDDYEKNVNGWLELVHPDDWDTMNRYLVDDVLGKKQGFDYCYRINRKPDGAVRWLHGTGKLDFDENGHPVSMMGTIRDITEQKVSEMELIKAKEKAEKANSLKTEFLHNMSHEIRTPMNGILGFSEMLNDPNITDEEKRYFTHIIHNSGNQLLRVIDDILEISSLDTRKHSIKKEPFCLNELITELISIYNLKSQERNIPLNFTQRFADGHCAIFSDKTKLSRILGNLIENALKFTHEGFIEIGYSLNEDKLVLFVKDTGQGISPENHKKIFERFVQEGDSAAGNEGLGLGLAISKENAMLLGGDIKLESEKGNGTTFYVTIPYQPVNEAELPEESFYRRRRKATKDELVIVIAEDEENNFLFLKILFEKECGNCFRILHAKNGQEAIDICRRNRDIDVVLMDLKMPFMDGFEATKRIKEFWPDIPIIAQTAYSGEQDRKTAISCGCDDFISKPIKRAQLFHLISKYAPREE